MPLHIDGSASPLSRDCVFPNSKQGQQQPKRPGIAVSEHECLLEANWKCCGEWAPNDAGKVAYKCQKGRSSRISRASICCRGIGRSSQCTPVAAWLGLLQRELRCSSLGCGLYKGAPQDFSRERTMMRGFYAYSTANLRNIDKRLKEGRRGLTRVRDC